ncbi:hypothetical protein RsTz2092_08150 [Deferribacterales bacterium RsTz2092]
MLVSTLCLLALVETGILSVSLPALDGNVDAYSVPSRQILDSLLWVVVIALAVKFRDKIEHNSRYVVIALSIYSLMVAADAYSVHIKRPKAQITSVDPLQAYNYARLNKENNVIMLLLDCTSQEVVEDVLKNDSELAAKFNGFINFTNNIGTGGFTFQSIPSIATGLYYDVEYMEDHRYRIVGAEESLVNYFNQLNYNWLFVSSATDTVLMPLSSDDSLTEDLSILTKGFIKMRIDYLAKLQAMPYLFKYNAAINYPSRRFSNTKSVIDPKTIIRNYPQDTMLDDVRAVLEVADTSDKSTFHFYHLLGGHPTLITNSNCSIDREHPKKLTYQNYYNQVHCALKGTADILQVLRKRDVYDNTTVVMLADHSCKITNISKNTELEENLLAFPFLMIKLRGGKAPLTDDNTPTSNIIVSKFLKEYEQSGYKMSKQQMDGVMRQDERKMVVNFGNVKSNVSVYGGIYLVDTNYNVTKISDDPVVHKKSTSDLKPLTIGHTYMLQNPDVTADLEYPTVSLKYALSDDSFVKFRVPQSDKQFTMELDLYLWGKHSDRAGSLTISTQDESYSQPLEKNKETQSLSYTLPVKSDKDGIITINVRSDIHIAQRWVSLSRLLLKNKTEQFAP